MDAVIVYGSSRGSTEKVGEAIAEGMEAAGASAAALGFDLLSMAPGRIDKADVIGIGSPTYFLREPEYITSYVSQLPSLAGKSVFVFSTCGMDRVGETLHRLQRLAEERGGTVVGAEWFRSAMSYYPHRKRGLGNPEHLPDEGVLDAARAFGKRMVDPDLTPITLEPPSGSTRFKAGLLANRRFRRAVFPRVRLVRTACTGYGSCISRCPFQALEREDEEAIPDLTDRCIQCLECIDSCPRAAIVADSALREWISTLSYRLGLH